MPKYCTVCENKIKDNKWKCCPTCIIGTTNHCYCESCWNELKSELEFLECQCGECICNQCISENLGLGIPNYDKDGTCISWRCGSKYCN